MNEVGTTIVGVVVTSLARLAVYLPQFLGGLIVLIVGVIVAAALKELVLRILQWVRLESWFEGLGGWFKTTKTNQRGTRMWSDLLAELVRWTVVILFLVPAVEAWGLPRVTEVLNQVLLFLPNVFVAVVVGFVGFAIANLVFELVQNSARQLGSNSSAWLANIARYSLIFFTILVVLNQLGVASELIRILFTGIVAMVAIAGGIAFGLGGQDSARTALKDLINRLEEREGRSVPVAKLEVENSKAKGQSKKRKAKV